MSQQNPPPPEWGPPPEDQAQDPHGGYPPAAGPPGGGQYYPPPGPPPGGPHDPYATHGQVPPGKPPRPTAVTVLGILNIVFGTLGICCGSIGGLGSGFLMIEEAVQGSLVLVTSIGLLLSAAMLAAGGIGLLMMQSWGRTLSIVAAVLFLLVGLVDLASGIAFDVRPLLASASDDTEMVAMAIGAMVGICCGGMLRIAYPAILIYYLFRADIRRLFQ